MPQQYARPPSISAHANPPPTVIEAACRIDAVADTVRGGRGPAVTDRVCSPSSRPSVQTAAARPAVFVALAAGLSFAPGLDADQLIGTPASALPSASRTSTSIASGRGQPGVPDCVAGERRRVSAGTGPVSVGSSPQDQISTRIENRTATFRPGERTSGTAHSLAGGTRTSAGAGDQDGKPPIVTPVTKRDEGTGAGCTHPWAVRGS